jgi:hypothetical protein
MNILHKVGLGMIIVGMPSSHAGLVESCLDVLQKFIRSQSGKELSSAQQALCSRASFWDRKFTLRSGDGEGAKNSAIAAIGLALCYKTDIDDFANSGFYKKAKTTFSAKTDAELEEAVAKWITSNKTGGSNANKLAQATVYVINIRMTAKQFDESIPAKSIPETWKIFLPKKEIVEKWKSAVQRSIPFFG